MLLGHNKKCTCRVGSDYYEMLSVTKYKKKKLERLSTGLQNKIRIFLKNNGHIHKHMSLTMYL